MLQNQEQKRAVNVSAKPEPPLEVSWEDYQITHLLGATAIKGALDKINLDPNLVDGILMGNAVQAGTVSS
jgi:hypothetical protein